MDIRKQESDHEVLVALSSPSGGITITDPVNGLFQIMLAREQAFQQLSPGSFVADLTRTLPGSGYAERILDCAVTVVEGTTR
jgi:hypothetical protein